MDKIKIGIIGCGNISDIYLQNLTSAFVNTEVWAVCDKVEERALAAKEKYKCHGHESWHPDPEFCYDIGGGPIFDMGPY